MDTEISPRFFKNMCQGEEVHGNILIGHVHQTNIMNTKSFRIVRVMPDVEVKIGEENEILLRGKTITKGYYKKAEATAAAIDKDGWFHTGDAGYLKGDQLYLTERIKDLFNSSIFLYSMPFSLA